MIITKAEIEKRILDDGVFATIGNFIKNDDLIGIQLKEFLEIVEQARSVKLKKQ